MIRGGDEQHPDRFPALLEAARREKEDAERAFADKSVAFGRDLSHVESGLDEVYAALPANAALVSFVRYDRSVVEPAGPAPSTSTRSRAARSRKAVPSYLAFVLRSEQPQPWVVPLGSASAIDALVARWHDETSPLSQGRLPAEAEPAYRSAGAALRRRT